MATRFGDETSVKGVLASLRTASEHVHSHTTDSGTFLKASGDRGAYGSRFCLADLTGMRSLLHSTWNEACGGMRFLDAQEMRKNWKRERRVGNLAAKRVPDPLSFSRCPPCSMSRSTSKTGSGRFILGPNPYGPSHFPRSMLSARGR